MKKLYNKIAPVISRIALVGLLLSIVALVISGLRMKTLTEPWPLYYATLANLIAVYAAWGFGAALLLSNIPLLREVVRKGIVALKRKPSLIPLLMMLAAFLVYSLNLTDISDTTALVQGKGMGLCQFCMMLFSMLAMLCMLNAFPRRKKANIPMLLLVFVMFGILIYCDIHYLNGIADALNNPENPIQLTKDNQYILKAYNTLALYQTMLFITAALVVLLPVYSKLIRKIKTSVQVEDNGAMAAIEISD